MLVRLAEGEMIGTHLKPASSVLHARKQWIADHLRSAGRLVLAGGEETPETEALARQLAQAYACVEYVSCSECYGDSG